MQPISSQELTFGAAKFLSMAGNPLPFGQIARRVLPCMLRNVRLDSNKVYSPSPLNVKLRPSKVKMWGSPKAEAVKRDKRDTK